MFINSNNNLIVVMLVLYLSAAMLSLLVYKNAKLSNILPCIINSTASILGIWTSASYLLYNNSSGSILKLSQAIPFVSVSLRIDRLSAFFILVLSALTFCVSVYSTGYLKHYYGKYNIGTFNFLYNLFIISMILVFLSGSISFFLIAWEIMAVSSYFLVIFEYDIEENRRAGIIYLIMTHIGTAFITIAFALMYRYSGSLNIGASLVSAPAFIKNIIFLCFLVGFGTKAGIIPLHIWLPYAHPAAPSNVSALMSGIMIKTAIYGLIRFTMGSLGGGYQWWGTLILIVGTISAVLGVIYAFMENNIKRLLAYSSIENIGIILIGFGISLTAYAGKHLILSVLALSAALLHLFNHAIFKGLLFLGAGSVHSSTHTKDMEELGGLLKKMPYTGLFFLIASLSISAFPPFNGFVGEWITYQALFVKLMSSSDGIKLVSILVVAALALAGALAAACFVKSFGTAFLALPRSEKAKHAKEVHISMLGSMGILSVMCFLFGIVPSLALKFIENIYLTFPGFKLLGTNYSIANNMKGYSFFLYYPITIGNNSISPLNIAFLGIIIAILVFVMVKLFNWNAKERKYGTWDCGFIGLNSRMQYSATGFSKPLRIVFRGIYRAGRELQVEQGSSPYYHKSMTYIVSTESIFENYLYKPVTNLYTRFSRKFRLVFQTGSVHTYLVYIFITILVLLLYNRLFL